MENNKIALSDGTTLLDLTEDTVTASGLARGLTAHDASGTRIVGSRTDGLDDVNFWDYDGVVVRSCSAEAFTALTALPEAPAHAGLTAQGWNWTLDDAQRYVAKYGRLNLGQTYITDDGATRLLLSLDRGGDRLSLPLCFSQTAANGVTVDWGDGSAPQSFGGTGEISASHTYPSVGDYTLSLRVKDGCALSFGDFESDTSVFGPVSDSMTRIHAQALRGLHLGSGVSRIGSYAFSNCIQTEAVTIPRGVSGIGSNAFASLVNLRGVTLPRGVTELGDSAFSGLYRTRHISFPNGVGAIPASAFYYCVGARGITLPDSVASVGAEAFYNCISARDIVVPDSVASLGNYAFSSCSALTGFYIGGGVSGIAARDFMECNQLKEIAIPDGVASIATYAFYRPCSAKRITIPDSVASIGTYAFYSPMSALSITVGSGVTSIGNNAFARAYALKELHVRPASPPTLGASSLADLSPDCVIYVPAGSLAAYQAAANWKTHAGRMQEE